MIISFIPSPAPTHTHARIRIRVLLMYAYMCVGVCKGVGEGMKE